MELTIWIYYQIYICINNELDLCQISLIRNVVTKVSKKTIDIVVGIYTFLCFLTKERNRMRDICEII